jgi:hypothetical protein
MGTPAVTCDNHNISVEALLKLLIRDVDCVPSYDCDNRDSWESLLKRLVSDVGDGTLALNVCDCLAQN